MTTTKSYSNESRFSAIYKSFLKRLFPIMMVYTIVYFLFLPLLTIVEIMEGVPGSRIMNSGVYVGSEASYVIYVVSAIMAVILALAANSYMHQKRTVDLYHSIPVTRTQLFTAGLLSSMTALFAPLLVNYGLAMIIQRIGYAGTNAVYGIDYALFIAQDLIFLAIYVLAVYLFVSFVSVNVGTLFDTFAISGIMGFSLMVIYMISGAVFGELTYGFNFSPGYWVLLLSPFTFIFFKERFFSLYYNYRYHFDFETYRNNPFWKNTEWGSVLVFLLCCVAFVALLWFLCVHFYKRRKSEDAERPQSSGVFQTIVKVFASFCGAALFFVIFMNNGAGTVFQIIAMIFGAVLIGVVAELVFSRGIRSLLRNLKWLAGTGALCGLLILAVKMDITGYVKRVPAVDAVESVTVTYGGRFPSLSEGYPWEQGYGYDYNPTLTDPQSIGLIAQAHGTAIADVPNRDGRGSYSWTDYPYTGLHVTYNLKNGRTMTRYYNQMSRDAYSLLSGLESQDDFISQASPLFMAGNPDSRYADYRLEGISLTNSLRSSTYRVLISDADTERLLDAMRRDMLAESLSEIMYPSKPSLGVVQLQYRGEDNTPKTNVIVTEEYTDTIALLRELDLYDRLIETDIVPDQVYITDSYGKLYQSDMVSAIGPSRYESYYGEKINDYSHGFIVYAQNDQEMDWIIATARSQMMVHSRTDNDTFIAVYCVGDRVVGSGFIAYNDLPPRIRQEVDKSPYLADNGLLIGRGVIPEAAVNAAS